MPRSRRRRGSGKEEGMKISEIRTGDRVRKDPGDIETGTEEPYVASSAGITWLKPTTDGFSPMPLTNFNARITTDILRDDGQGLFRSYEIETELAAQKAIIEVPACQFASMNWIPEHLGSRAIVSPGFGLRDHTRAAIQFLSKDVRERRV